MYNDEYSPFKKLLINRRDYINSTKVNRLIKYKLNSLSICASLTIVA